MTDRVKSARCSLHLQNLGNMRLLLVEGFNCLFPCSGTARSFKLAMSPHATYLVSACWPLKLCFLSRHWWVATSSAVPQNTETKQPQYESKLLRMILILHIMMVMTVMKLVMVMMMTVVMTMMAATPTHQLEHRLRRRTFGQTLALVSSFTLLPHLQSRWRPILP